MVSDSELAASEQNAKEHIALAADLHCPFVHVFGGPIAVGLAHVAAIRLAAERLRELGDHAVMRGVKVLTGKSRRLGRSGLPEAPRAGASERCPINRRGDVPSLRRRSLTISKPREPFLRVSNSRIEAEIVKLEL
jgi:hypothetical protein